MKHYAGDVEYRTDGWLEKNRDPLNNNLTRVLLMPFVEFLQRYEVLTPGIIPCGCMDGRKASIRMVDMPEPDKTLYSIGTPKIVFKASVHAELEERCDTLLFDILSRFQATARTITVRRQMKKVLKCAMAIRTIQRITRVYDELRDWPWWQLYTKVRPLLTATRNDEELRRKELELALIKERAEREQREKEALESLKMRLEAEKRNVEDLEAERALGIDKDSLLKRSKKRELELEDDVAALQSDLGTLDSQLDRAMANHTYRCSSDWNSINLFSQPTYRATSASRKFPSAIAYATSLAAPLPTTFAFRTNNVNAGWLLRQHPSRSGRFLKSVWLL